MQHSHAGAFHAPEMNVAVTQVFPTSTSGGAKSNNSWLPLQGKNLYRFSLVVGADNDTFDTGLSGIVETAITGTRSTSGDLHGAGTVKQTLQFASGDCTILGVTGSTVTFSVAGSTALDLLVWAN